MRRTLFDARTARTPEERERAHQAICRYAVELVTILKAQRVAAYLPVRTEPGGPAFADELLRAGTEVLLPRCAPNRQLEWAHYTGPDSVAPAQFGLLEPTAPALPARPLDSCDLIFVPALAATSEGFRLGKGGGFYDIALSSLSRNVPTAVVLYAQEIRDDLPLEPHDEACDYLVTERGIARFPL